MKKSIYLIAPLTFLMSCSGTSEIFDDAYDDVKAPKIIENDDQAGYSDYIKNQESNYQVEVEEDQPQNRSFAGNPSFYNSYDDYYEEDGHVTHNHVNNNYYNSYPNQGFNFCQYSCMNFNRYGSCWHTRQYSGYYAYQPYYGGYYGGGYWGNGGYYNPYCPPNSGWGFGYNSYYGYGNGFYSNYGYNGWNSWGSPYWGNGYYNGYNNGFYTGFYNGYYSNPNNGNWNSGGNQDVTSNGNHYYGHRGGTNTGTNSQNTTTYEHTVKESKPADNVSSKPFPSYNSAIAGSKVTPENIIDNRIDPPKDNGGNVMGQGTGSARPVNNNTAGNPFGNNGDTDKIRPNNNVSNNVKPTNSGGNYTLSNDGASKPQRNIVNKPAINQFDSNSDNRGGNNTAGNNTGGNSGNYKPTTTPTNSGGRYNKYNSGGNTINTGNNGGSSRTYNGNSSNRYNSGNTNSPNRNNNSNSNNRNYNSNSNNRGGSVNSGSSSSGNRGGGSSGSSGSTSRRR